MYVNMYNITILNSFLGTPPSAASISSVNPLNITINNNFYSEVNNVNQKLNIANTPPRDNSPPITADFLSNGTQAGAGVGQAEHNENTDTFIKTPYSDS